MEPTASGTSSSEDQSTPSNSPVQNSQHRPIRTKTSKLQPSEVMKIVFWIATFEKVPQIVRNVEEQFGIKIHPMTVEYYKRNPKFEKTIRQIREKWGNDLLHCELATKRRRMQELEKIYHMALMKQEMKTALTSLYQIKNEVEKDLTNLNMNQYNINIFKDLSDAELEQERLKSIERLKTLKGEIIDASPVKSTATSDDDGTAQPVESESKKSRSPFDE